MSFALLFPLDPSFLPAFPTSWSLRVLWSLDALSPSTPVVLHLLLLLFPPIYRARSLSRVTTSRPYLSPSRPYFVSLVPTLSHLRLIRLTLFYALFLARANRRLPTILNFAFFACPLFSSPSVPFSFSSFRSVTFSLPLACSHFCCSLSRVPSAIKSAEAAPRQFNWDRGREKERRGEQRFVNSDPVHRTRTCDLPRTPG